MVKKTGIAVIILTLLTTACMAAEQWKPPKVAVVPFAVQNSRIPENLATESHKSMCEALAKSKRYELFSQDNLKKWLEKNLPDVKGTLETISAARIGESLGCDLVICGTVLNTAIQDGEYRDSFGIHNARMAQVAVDFTVVNVKAARIVTRETVKGVEVKEINADTRRFDEDLVRRAAWNSAADFITGFYYPSDGRVLVIEEARFKVGLGKNQGITEQTVFEIFAPGLEIRDPGNGELVGYEEGENLYARPVKGTIEADSCYAEIGKWKDVTKFLFESSEWRPDPGKLKSIQVGDRVRIRTPFGQQEEEQ